MKFDEESLAVIEKYLEDPNDSRALDRLGALYWRSMITGICNSIREELDIIDYLEDEKDFINSGIIEDVLENLDDTKNLIEDGREHNCYLQTMDVIDWLKEVLWKVNAGDKSSMIKSEIRKLKQKRNALGVELQRTQKSRKELLLRAIDTSKNSSLKMTINSLMGNDRLALQNLEMKKEAAKGVYFPSSVRKEFAAQTDRLQKEEAKKEILFKKVTNPDDRADLRRYNTRIAEILDDCIGIQDSLKEKESELEKNDSAECEFSPLELENKVREEIEYLRDMTKLSAKRLHMESHPILRSNVKFFTHKIIEECFDRIIEFDPRIFYNDRTPYFGKPTVILVPGTGNGVYDWKENRFVIPMIPLGGNYMASVAAVVIEYRLDVDRDKKLLNLYQKLPSMKNIRYINVIRDNLVKDYIKWMTSEYKGYKVLSKEIRTWFEHEIAPSKNDIFCPPEYKTFEMSSNDFNKLLEETEEDIKNDLLRVSPQKLWIGSILQYQQGEFNKSYDYLKEYLDIHHDNMFAYYNMGVVGMKVSQKQEAIKGFNVFVQQNPQSWWASVARDNIRRLQIM